MECLVGANGWTRTRLAWQTMVARAVSKDAPWLGFRPRSSHADIIPPTPDELTTGGAHFALQAGVEPATNGLGSRCSIH
jgi:hypothetical protein